MPRYRDQNEWTKYATLHNHSIGASYDHSFYSRRECTDQVHRNYPYAGGPAVIRSLEYTVSPAHFPHSRWPGGVNDYDGSLVANVDRWAVNLATAAINPQPHLNDGYYRTKPGKPQVGIGVAVGELRDLTLFLQGSLLKAAFNFVKLRSWRNKSKEWARAYLEWEFGYKQIIRDIRGLYNTWKNLDSMIDQLAKQANKPFRRRVTLLTTNATYPFTDTAWANFAPVNINPIVWYWVAASGQHIVEQKYHYVAKFKFGDFPEKGAGFWSSKCKRVLFGVNPDPSLLWNVMPWTWLTDWFLGIGPALERISSTAVENLTLMYEYVVFEESIETTLNTAGLMKSKVGPMTLRGFSTRKEKIYNRQGSSLVPFAGLLPKGGNLTIYQLAILAALGLK